MTGDRDVRTAFKLVRLRRNGTLGSLFINRRAVLPVGVWMDAEEHRTKGYAFRPGWHVSASPHLPHLVMRDRVWVRVEIADYRECVRPEAQGGLWFLAGKMKITDIWSLK